MAVVITDEMIDEFEADALARIVEAERVVDGRRIRPPCWVGDLSDAVGNAVAGAGHTTGVSDSELMAAELELAAARDSLAAAEARVLSELDSRDATAPVEGVRTGTWLGRARRTATGKARHRVRTANTLTAHFGVTLDAVADGKLSWEHAEVIANAANDRNAEEFSAHQWQFISMAQTTTFGRWRQHVEYQAHLLDQDGPEPAPDLGDNRLWATRLTDGTSQLKGQLVGAEAEEFRVVLDAEMSRVFRHYQHLATTNPDVKMPNESTIRAMALVELARKAHSAGPDLTPTAAHATMIVNTHDPSAPDTPDGAHLARGTIERLLCDCSISTVVLDSLGLPLDVRRTHRLATPAIRDAVWARDGGCVNRGCDNPAAWVRYHHVQFWDDGGHTKVANIVALCPTCHGLAHSKGWSVEITDDQWTIWTTPSQRRYWGQRHGHTRSDAVPSRPLRKP